MSFEEIQPETLKVRRVTPSSAEPRSLGDSTMHADNTNNSRFHVPGWALVVGSFVLIGILQWLPFGWNVSPRVDGWTLLADVDSGLRPYIFISSDLVTRPFFFWIWILNHHFDPNNFVLLNLILMVMMIIRGTALYTLIRQVFPQQALFAYLSGALLMVFPADSGTYYEGATHVLLSLTLQLVALNLLVWYWKDRRWWQFALALLVESVSVGNYEIGILLYLATPLILWWLDRRITPRLLIVTPLWWLSPGLSLFVAYADVYFNPASHHSSMLDKGGVSYTHKLINAIRVQYWTAYQQGFTQMFHAQSSASGQSNLAAALGITLIAAVIATWLLIQKAPNEQFKSVHMLDTPLHWLLVSFAGFLAMLLGIAMFLPSNQLDSFASYQPVRLFYFSAVGAVLTVTALAFAIDRGLRARGLLATIVLVCVIAGGSMSLLTQHQQWQDYTWQQQRLIGSILRQTGHIDDNTLILVVDRSNGELSSYYPFNYQFEAAMQLITDNYTLKARLCFNNDTDQADTRYCHFQPGNVQIPDIWAGDPGYTFPYNRVIGFVLGSDGSVMMLHTIPLQLGQAKGYNPTAQFDLAAGLPPRYFTMLSYPGH